MLPPHNDLFPPLTSQLHPDAQQAHNNRKKNFWQVWWDVRSVVVMVAFTVCTLVVCCHAATKVTMELVHIYKSQQRMRVLQADVAAIESELVNLQAIIANGENRVYLEQLARQQGFVYPDDRLIRTFDADDNPVVYGQN